MYLAKMMNNLFIAVEFQWSTTRLLMYFSYLFVTVVHYDLLNFCRVH